MCSVRTHRWLILAPGELRTKPVPRWVQVRDLVVVGGSGDTMPAPPLAHAWFCSHSRPESAPHPSVLAREGPPAIRALQALYSCERCPSTNPTTLGVPALHSDRRGATGSLQLEYHLLPREAAILGPAASLWVSKLPLNTNFFFLKEFIYFFVDRGEERERNINVWLTLLHPTLGTWPATHACALTGNQTGNPVA